MRTLYLDTFSGISGDMLLGLLVDLGVSLDDLLTELGRLPVSGYQVTAKAEQRHGIGGTRVKVSCTTPQPHRRWTDIDLMLAESDLPQGACELARRAFRLLGEAEATVHKVSLNDVHFHEVGAIDAIVDVVGCAIGLQMLQIDRTICSPLPLSHGLTRGAHGPLPLPAPATLEILKGQPIRNGDSDRELVTPTGAALAVTIAEFGPLPEMIVERNGYGVGGWQLADRPNLLRGILGVTSGRQGLEQDRVCVIESHLDDTPAEWLGSLLDRLLEAGALDVGYTPVQMKKNRPGIRVTVVAPPQLSDSLARMLLRETSSIRLRIYECQRLKLRRETVQLDTEFGQLGVKLIYEGAQLLRVTPEHADCARVAAQSGRPLPDIYRIISALANRQFGLD